MRYFQYRTEPGVDDSFTVLSANGAIAHARREMHDPGLSPFVCIEWFISKYSAIEVPDPNETKPIEVDIRDYMRKYVGSHGGEIKAAARLNVHENVVKDVIAGRRLDLPRYVLKALGLGMRTTVYPLPTNAKP